MSKMPPLSAPPPAQTAPLAEEILPIHFFTIVLNGQPFIQHHIEELRRLPFRWHWHIIEGVAELNHDTAWSRSFGGKIPAGFHRNGLSRDGTTEYLDALKNEFPGHVTVYRPGTGCFWDGKSAMVNAPLRNIKEECLLWQVDVDELWTASKIIRARDLFLTNPQRTAAFFYCHYFVGPNLVVTTRDTYGNYSAHEWLRVWRSRPGDFWAAHEPPRLCRGQTDVGLIHPFRNAETEAAGLVFHHYAYALESQIQFKESYYGYAGAVAGWRRLQAEKNFPQRLADFFDWVKDKAMVSTATAAGVSPLAPAAWFASSSASSNAPYRPEPTGWFYLKHKDSKFVRSCKKRMQKLMRLEAGFTPPAPGNLPYRPEPAGWFAPKHTDGKFVRSCKKRMQTLLRLFKLARQNEGFVSEKSTLPPTPQRQMDRHGPLPAMHGYDFYICHYQKNSERLEYLNGLKTDLKFITNFDREEINLPGTEEAVGKKTLYEQLHRIRHLLKFNEQLAAAGRENRTISPGEIYDALRKSKDVEPWLASLAAGLAVRPAEASLFLKHLAAWKQFAASRSGSWAVVAEDDIIFKDDSLQRLNDLVAAIPSDVDYVDLGGGAGLQPQPAFRLLTPEIEGLYLIDPPSSRTTCAYLINRRFIEKILSGTHQPTMPIDWYVAYLMQVHAAKVCWIEPTIFVHGSEHGYYRSTLR